MKVEGKGNIPTTRFKDLEKGEVFFLSNDNKSDKQIFMKCAHTSELAAVNLETGTCYNYYGDESVVVVCGEFTIKHTAD